MHAREIDIVKCASQQIRIKAHGIMQVLSKTASRATIPALDDVHNGCCGRVPARTHTAYSRRSKQTGTRHLSYTDGLPHLATVVRQQNGGQ